jgi:protein-S-isoprenylcysteine O-methyltransferase Ste14
MTAVLVARIINEEAYLREHLNGYNAYCHRMRYRLLPGIW